MATATASGVYDVTTAATATATGTYNVTTPAPGTVTATASGTYDVRTPVATVTVTASGTYNVTAGTTTVSASGQYDVTTPTAGTGRSVFIGGDWLPLKRARLTAGTWMPISDDLPVTVIPSIIGYIGDSTTVQNITNAARDSIYTLGYTSSNAKVDGLVGRSIVDGVAPYIPSSQTVVSTWRSGGYHPNLWVIGLISNNFGQTLTQLKTAINTLLNLLVAEPVKKVLWVGPVVPLTSSVAGQIPTMYQALNEVAATRSDLDMRVLDLSAAIHNGRDESGLWNLGNDSPAFRHMTDAGYAIRNDLIRTFVDANISSPVR